MLEANPRASRTVPFASKATGLNLVEAACRLAAGEQAARPRAAARAAAGAGQRQGRGAAVRALPRQRSGARARRCASTGEVMASRLRPADRLREGRARRRPPAPDLGHRVPLGAGRRQAGARTRRRRARRARLQARRDRGHGEDAPGGGARGRAGRARWRRAGRRPSSTCPARALRSRREHAVGGSLQRTDGYRIREAALVARVPCITTISGAAAAVHAIANARTELASRSRSGSMPRRERRTVTAAEAVGPVHAAARRPRRARAGRARASSSCSRRPAGCCRGR